LGIDRQESRCTARKRPKLPLFGAEIARASREGFTALMATIAA
jgi:hypothetical protein